MGYNDVAVAAATPMVAPMGLTYTSSAAPSNSSYTSVSTINTGAPR